MEIPSKVSVFNTTLEFKGKPALLVAINDQGFYETGIASGIQSVIRDFDAVSPANALGDIPAPAARRHDVAREAARQLKRNRWLHEEDHPK